MTRHTITPTMSSLKVVAITFGATTTRSTKAPGKSNQSAVTIIKSWLLLCILIFHWPDTGGENKKKIHRHYHKQNCNIPG